MLCADGLLVADLKAEFSRTLPKAGAVDIDVARKIFAELTRQADDWLTAEKVAPADRQQTKVAMLRYHGQGGEVAVPWHDGKDGLAAAFASAHQGLYGFVLDAPVELVTLLRMIKDRPALAASIRKRGRSTAKEYVWDKVIDELMLRIEFAAAQQAARLSTAGQPEPSEPPPGPRRRTSSSRPTAPRVE